MNLGQLSINRPILAMVMSIVLLIVGAIAYTTLPVAEYPQVVPPTVVVTTQYPGASAQTVSDTVAAPIEQQINGVEDMLYLYSQATSNGQLTITVTFKLGTDLDKAQVLVQNRVAIAQPQLPEEVQRTGPAAVISTKSIPFSVVNLLSGTLEGSIPIMLGALTAVICSTSGVINIAIEGQLLLGAFCAAIATTVTGSLWLGLICGALAGSLVAALLAAFAIAYRVDQIVLGVVLNTLVLGLTGYLYNAIMVPYGDTLNNPATFNLLKIPLLGDIPIIGPVFFDASVFLYITYGLLLVIQVGLTRTRWGLRTRAVGEHPVAADTVGIRVLAIRYRNVIIAGLIAGIGGAYFTIGSVGSFGPDMTSGEGYIALAAMIFGRYTPFGAIGAALLFGFTTQLQSILSSINVPIQSNLLLLTPYVVTIIVVAGLVGKVRGPRAEGVPYVKS